ncbi:glutamate-cysteine ligase family protein [Desulfovibrio aminophilus]|uniref:carboxylate-amine ligase n=1 Tax=Desulfovibrio aminophilus TaxID=81425 RepID=UPI003391A5E8
MSEPLHLFQGYGVELEYMIVDARTLDVYPAADRLLEAAAGHLTSDVEFGDTAWSNELVLHVIEFKTNGPASSLEGLSERFAADVARANGLLAPIGGQLMPGGAHPWMDPNRETELWPHEYNAVYAAFNRIFNCQGHGWANLQSMHLNLPFSGDEEFGRLHAAIRLILPILPALSASTPILDGRATGLADSRMEAYRHNSERIPQVAGRVVPERAFTRREYEKRILKPMFKAIRPHDKEGILRHEWLNARGAIARFERDAVEIRVLDTQECPAADLAVAALAVAAIRATAAETWQDWADQKKWEAEPLARILENVIRDGHQAVIDDPAYLHALGLTNRRSCKASEIWLFMAKNALPTDGFDPSWRKPLELLLTKGTLASRMLARLNGDLRRERLQEVYAELCACLAENRPFES